MKQPERRPWMPAREAASILRARGANPIESLSALVRETGEYGLNKSWALGNHVQVRSETHWLTAPQINVDVGTIVVPTRAPGRRLPEDRPEPLLINPYELDRRWPDPAALPPSKRKGGGRPTKIDEAGLESAFRLKVIEEDGVPGDDMAQGWQKQAHAEKWVTEWLEERNTPLQESAVRTRVARLIKKIQDEAGN